MTLRYREERTRWVIIEGPQDVDEYMKKHGPDSPGFAKRQARIRAANKARAKK